MEDDKPTTALVLLSPLSLVQPESLPTKCSQELTSLTQQRTSALNQLRASLVIASGISVGTVFFLGLSLLAWINPAPILISAITTLFSLALSYASILAIRWHAGDVKEYRKIVISPQLQIGAENELILSEMAYVANNSAVTWNKRVESALPEEIDKRFLKALKKDRELISAKLEQVKKVAEAIERDGFDILDDKKKPKTE